MMRRTITMALLLAGAWRAGAAEEDLLKNGDFAVRTDTGLPAQWRAGGPQKVSIETNALPKGHAQALRVDIVQAVGANLGEIGQTVRVKTNTAYRLDGLLHATKPRIAVLAVKLRKDGKEIGRQNSEWNGKDWTPASFEFASGEGDEVQVLCRWRQAAKDKVVGQTAWFAGLSLVEKGPAAASVAVPPPVAGKAVRLPYAGPEVGPTAISTFHCVGLYWKPAGGAADRTCTARYRLKGDAEWHEALPLWFDPHAHEGLAEHSQEYRGSIVRLQSGTEYEVELSLGNGGPTRTLLCATWSEEFKIARRVDLPLTQPAETYVIREGGDPTNGYVLYSPPQSQPATWDARGQIPAHIRVETPYVIVRGLTLCNAQINGIELAGVHHVAIEDCDISGWGRVRQSDGFGENLDAAVYSNSNQLEHIIVQRCHLHHPRSDSNSWKEQRVGGTFHPGGAQGVVFRNGKGHYVIRYNRIESDLEHMFNDGIGEVRNFSFSGFPNRDSDVYGNFVSHCWDDGLEIEGANMNVRVWENYITMTYGAIGAASTSLGPSYYFRNVYAASRKSGETNANAFLGHYLIKLGAEPESRPPDIGA